MTATGGQEPKAGPRLPGEPERDQDIPHPTFNPAARTLTPEPRGRGLGNVDTDTKTSSPELRLGAAKAHASWAGRQLRPQQGLEGLARVRTTSACAGLPGSFGTARRATWFELRMKPRLFCLRAGCKTDPSVCVLGPVLRAL